MFRRTARSILKAGNSRVDFARRFPDTHDVVLHYHAIGGVGWDSIPPAWFRSHLEWLATQYRIVDLPKVLTPSPEKRIVLTFDDGLQCFYDTVLPLVREYEIPVTVYVIGDAIRDREPDYMPVECEFMTRAQLEELVDDPLVTVGNHTRTHARLPTLDRDAIKAEVNGGKEVIDTELGTDVDRFCYPHGEVDPRVVDVVSDRHETAVVGGDATPKTVTDPYLVPRTSGAVPPGELRWHVPDFPKCWPIRSPG